jgi:hypothetical protein
MVRDAQRFSTHSVMAGLVPAIHDLLIEFQESEVVDT